jgi:D-glycero-D-manno-heptose 1,7-bisphosphate phosphatase
MLSTDVILMAGLPASGKTSITKQYEDLGYKVLSLDKKNMYCATETASLEKELNLGNKVVIDNTNSLSDVRKRFIDCVKNHNMTIGIHSINTTKDDCLINSLNRMYDRHGEVYMHLSDVPAKHKSSNLFVISAIFTIAKNFEKISKYEGFDQLEITKFVRTDSYGYINKAIFVDLDGTVRKSNGELAYPIEIEDIEILEHSEEVLRKYKDQGYKIIAVTNQSGISKKILTASKVKELIEHTNKLLGDVIDDYNFCPHLPPRDVCYCRKPQSGFGVLMMHKYQLDLSSCIMVGDATSDKTFAERLGMKYQHQNFFFDR